MDAAKPVVTCYVGTVDGPTQGMAIRLTRDLLDLIERSARFLQDNGLHSIDTKGMGREIDWLTREPVRIIGTNLTIYPDGQFKATGIERDAHQDSMHVASDNLHLAQVRKAFEEAVAGKRVHFTLYEEPPRGSASNDYLDPDLVACHAGRLLARKAEDAMAGLVLEAPARAPRPGL